jgi:hypothetical protein
MELHNEQDCFIQTFKNAQDHFIKRIWNTLVKFDVICYYKLQSLIITLWTFNIFHTIQRSLNFIINSILLESFKLFKTPKFSDFSYDDNKTTLNNLYTFTRKTIKSTTTVVIPESRNRVCFIIGFICCILPEFLIRKFILAPLMFIAFGLLLLTSWVGIFIIVPVVYFAWYIVKLSIKVVTVILCIVFSCIFSIILILFVISYYLFISLLTKLVFISVFIVYPVLFVIRCFVLFMVTCFYYTLRTLSLIKRCCFLETKK